MLKETLALIISGTGLGLGVAGVKNDIVWLTAIGFIAFFVGLRIAVGILIDRKIKKAFENKTK